jgi:hypothetical protein
MRKYFFEPAVQNTAGFFYQLITREITLSSKN